MIPRTVLPLLLSSAAFVRAAPTTYKKAPVITWGNCADAVPSEFDATGVNFGALPSTLHCGNITVPMDYAKAQSATNEIILAVAMLMPAKPTGNPIFYGQGGSDPGVLVMWQEALNQSSLFSGLYDHTILAMDIRGTYASNPIYANLSLFDTILNPSAPFPTNETAWNEIVVASKALTQSWVDLSTPVGIFQHLGTIEIAQDYESIRAALDYPIINFIGISAGTYRGQQYAHSYPQHVGAFVLDANIPHGRDYIQSIKDQTVAANRALERADAYCLNDTTCPFYGQGKGSVIKNYQTVLAASEKAPLTAVQCVGSSQCYADVGPSEVQQGILNLLSGQPDFPVLFESIAGALEGDATGFATGPVPVLDPVWAVGQYCNDYAFPSGWAGWNQAMQEAATVDTANIGRTLFQYIWIGCAGFPYSHSNNPSQTIFVPILYVTADFEADAPTEWATFQWENTFFGNLVVRHGDDHVTFLLKDQEAVGIEKTYLRTGILPAPKSDSSVTVYTKGQTRAPVMSPYLAATGTTAGDIDSS